MRGGGGGRYLRPWPLFRLSLASSFTFILHLSLFLSLSPSLLRHTSRLKLGWKKKTKKHNDLTIDFLFPYHLRLLPFAIRQDPNDFHSLSPPLPSSSRLSHPAILPALLHFFSVAFFPPSLSSAPSFLPLIGIALFEMEKLFTLTARAFLAAGLIRSHLWCYWKHGNSKHLAPLPPPWKTPSGRNN